MELAPGNNAPGTTGEFLLMRTGLLFALLEKTK
jgi:hypothetical protein